MAGLKIGVYHSLYDINKNWKSDRCFVSKINKSKRRELINGWQQAIRRTLIH